MIGSVCVGMWVGGSSGESTSDCHFYPIEGVVLWIPRPPCGGVGVLSSAALGFRVGWSTNVSTLVVGARWICVLVDDSRW
jgi:hypothetical protein